MHSSISNSERTVRSATVALLLGCAALIVFFEAGARFGFQKISRIQSRILSERKRFLDTRDSNAVVLLGNSLLVSDVDMEQLENELKASAGSRLAFSRFAIEQTGYLDWYFGLKNLFARGARPGTVVLLFDASHWLSKSVRGEYFAYELLAGRDLVELGTELGLDRTTLSAYGFANISAWLGGRSEIRKFILGRILFSIQPFLERIGRRPFSFPSSEDAYPLIHARMAELKRLCEEYGVRLVVAIPPTLDGIEPQEAILRAGEALGVRALRPAAPGTYDRTLFSDGYHLSPAGAFDFSHKFADSLRVL